MFDKLFKIEENWVVFNDLFSKNGNGDSIRPIAEELRKRRPDMKFFFCCRKKNILKHIDMADEILIEKSLKYNYVCSKAKYIVSPIGLPRHGKKRKGQIIVETWHGSPIKKLYLSRDKNNKKYQRYANQFKNVDIFVLQGEVFRKLYMEAFSLKSNQFIESGVPRNEVLLTKPNLEEIKTIKTNLGIPFGKKVILYAPTWKRYDHKMILPFDIEYLKNNLGEEYLLIIRSHVGKHAWVDSKLKPITIFDENFCFDGSKADDATTLYKIADITISDYSSVIFDFGLLKKPQILYIHDIEEYKENFGLYFDYKTFTPFPKVKTQEELVDAIQNYPVLAEKYDEFLTEYCNYEKIGSAKKIVNKMLGDINND